jgi:hypothetical protein
LIIILAYNKKMDKAKEYDPNNPNNAKECDPNNQLKEIETNKTVKDVCCSTNENSKGSKAINWDWTEEQIEMFQKKASEIMASLPDILDPFA